MEMVLKSEITAMLYRLFACAYVASVLITAPPKVSNAKIIGDLRENGKITATGIVTGGTEASSRVQWYKTCSSILDENSLEALSTSKIAKVGSFFLGGWVFHIELHNAFSNKGSFSPSTCTHFS